MLSSLLDGIRCKFIYTLEARFLRSLLLNKQTQKDQADFQVRKGSQFQNRATVQGAVHFLTNKISRMI